MKTTHLICYAALLSAPVVLAGSSMLGHSQDPAGPRPIPADPHTSPVELVEARRFTLGKELVHTWRADRMKYDSGWLLVLKADPGLIQPRQGPEPVLYVGAQTAERVNSSVRSGHVVAIVPGDFLLTDVPIFFGFPDVPEQLAQLHMDRELARALAADVKPPSFEVVAAAVDARPLHVADRYRLRMAAVDLVAKHSPQETDFIRGERVPLIR